ncbi:hypothetical protein [Methylobacterium sp. CM6247]
MVSLSLSLIYRYGPSRRRAKWRWVTWGSALAAFLRACTSGVFSCSSPKTTPRRNARQHTTARRVAEAPQRPERLRRRQTRTGALMDRFRRDIGGPAIAQNLILRTGPLVRIRPLASPGTVSFQDHYQEREYDKVG